MLTRRDALKVAATLAATGVPAPALAAPSLVLPAPAPAPAPSARESPLAALATDGDYELHVWITFDLEQYSGEDARRVVPALPGLRRQQYPPAGSRFPEGTASTSGEFILSGSRFNGTWRHRLEADEADGWGGGAALLDVRDQTAGADPLALLLALLHGDA